jgi:hypothetical protein
VTALPNRHDQVPDRRTEEAVVRAAPALAILHTNVVPVRWTGAGGSGRDMPRLTAPVLQLVAGVIVLGLVLTGAPAAVRVAPVLTYVAAVPGLACIRLLRPGDVATTAALGVGLSLALAVLVAQAMVYTGWWSPALGVAVLVTIASAASAAEIVRGMARRPRHRRERSRDSDA